MKSFSDKGLEIIKKKAEENDSIENYHFLKHLINIQSIQKFETINRVSKNIKKTIKLKIAPVKKTIKISIN